MNAAHLLATVTARGATARAEIGDDGVAVLVVAPRSVIGDLLPDLQRFKPELLALLNTPDDVATVAHRWASVTGDTSATDAAAPDVAALAPTGSATAMAPGDVSAIAPDVLPQLTQGESAALLARYRAGGAVLTLEMVEHDGAPSLALGIELTSRVAPEKRARAFQRITNHESRFRIGARARTGKRAHNRRRRGGIALRARRSGIRGATINIMKLLNITPETLANNANCKNRDARRYLARRAAARGRL